MDDDATIAHQQSVITRLQSQLAKAVEKLGFAPTASDDAVAAAPGWLLEGEVSAPLLAAYDARIAELEESSKSLYSGLRAAQVHVEEVSRENNALREQLKASLAAKAAAAASATPVVSPIGTPVRPQAGAGRGGDAARVSEMSEQLRLATAESGVLREEVNALSRELADVRMLLLLLLLMLLLPV
jgi:hypothetical protein